MGALISTLRAAMVMMVMLTVLFGGVYPVAVLLISQSIFEFRANGSLVERDGHVVGSGVLGQSFEQPKYFWGRLSATEPAYNAAASSGSNLSADNPKLLDAVNARTAALQKADPKNHDPIPVDLVTASASGLDPDISVAAAKYQAARVAKARNMKIDDVLQLIERQSQRTPTEVPRVNVLKLNLSLDGK